MKKILVFITLVLVLLLTVSCKKKPETDPAAGDTAPITENVPPEIDEPTELYGMFDERFIIAFENVIFMNETFTGTSEAFPKYNQYVKSYPMNDIDSASKRLPLLYHLAKELGADKTLLLQYFTVLEQNKNIAKVPDESVLLILEGSDIEAVMNACAHPAALAKGDRVFSLRMLLEGDVSAFGVTDEEIKGVVERALEHYGRDKLFDERVISGTMKTRLAALGFDITAPEKAEGSLCKVHSDSYHTIPEELKTYVGASEFAAWEKDAKAASGCESGGFNIASFVKHFGITAYLFIEMYNDGCGTMGDYPIELICSGDAAAVEEYYSLQHKDAEREVAINRDMAKLKQKVIADNSMDGYFMSVHECSLPELLFMIDYDETYIESLKSYIKTLPSGLSIDFERIYESRENIMKMIMKRTVYYVDCTASGRTSFDTAYEARAAFDSN